MKEELKNCFVSAIKDEKKGKKQQVVTNAHLPGKAGSMPHKRGTSQKRDNGLKIEQEWESKP